MEIIIQQTKKEMFSAEFNIIDKLSGQLWGQIWFNSGLGSMEGNFLIRYQNVEIKLSPVSKDNLKKYAGNLINKSVYRPYQLTVGANGGFIWLDENKQSALKSYSYRSLVLGNAIYQNYVVGFGEKGICAPIYCNDVYVGEIRKECKVIDDLHIFDIGSNDDCIIPAIIIACHKWVVGYYNAGEVYKGWRTRKYTTTDKELIAKVKNPHYTVKE